MRPKVGLKKTLHAVCARSTTRNNTLHRGTSLIRNSATLGPYSRSMTTVVLGGGLFLLSEVLLYGRALVSSKGVSERGQWCPRKCFRVPVHQCS